MAYTYSPEDSVSNEIASTVQSAQCAGVSVERFVELTIECWVEQLQRDIDRIKKLTLG